MFVAGAAPKGSLFGTGKATGVVVLEEEFKPKPGNPEFVVCGGGAAVAAGNGPPETEVASAVALGPKPELALLLPIFGQADELLFCTGLVPVVGQGLVLSCVKLEAPEISILQITFYFQVPQNFLISDRKIYVNLELKERGRKK